MMNVLFLALTAVGVVNGGIVVIVLALAFLDWRDR